MLWLKLLIISFVSWGVLAFGALVPAVQAASSSQAGNVTKNIQTGLCAGSNLDFTGHCPTGTNASKTATKIAQNIINLLSAVVGVVAVAMIIFGGFRYITSGGNDASVTGAKNTILYAIIGLVVVALSQIIVHFVLARINSATG